MAKIIIDGKEVETKEGKNCLEAALENNIDVPYFCYHPALGSVGSCRLCAVKVYKDENDKQGRMVMSCMEPVTDGKLLSVEDQETVAFRAWITEFLMINHPHDCPICDEGGECHLQDMTVMTGHRKRRYRGPKRTHTNQNLGPLINHEMNRCIQCYRCTRYYQDYAGGHDLVTLKQHNNVYFGRYEEGTLESPFSGNLIDVCPTGVFTDKTSKDHYVRKWDLESAPSLCTQCGVGCNTIPGARYGKLRRVLPRYNEAVNSYFMCDRGRFGYEYHNAETRLREPAVYRHGQLQTVDAATAWNRNKEFVHEGAKVAAIGSPRTSVEANFALQQLVGAENFSTGLSKEEQALVDTGLKVYQSGSFKTPDLQDIEQADAVFVLGANVTHEVPRHDLSIRQAINKGASLHIAASKAGLLEEVATATSIQDPYSLVKTAAEMLKVLQGGSSSDEFITQSVTALKQAKRPVIIAGWYHGQTQLLELAAALANALQGTAEQAHLLIAFPEANTVGVGLLGGSSVDDILARIDSGEIERLIILENDLFERSSQVEHIAATLNKLGRLLVMDHSANETTALASDLIPVAAPAEANGLFINAEGRAARAYQVYFPEPWVPQAWEVLRDMPNADDVNKSEAWTSPDLIMADLIKQHPSFAPAAEITPPPSYRIEGQKIARMSHRVSGRTAMPNIKDVSQHLKPPTDDETPFSFSMEGSAQQPDSNLIPRFWSPNWNSQEAINKFQIELGLGLHGGAPGIRLLNPNGANATAPKPEINLSQGQDGELLLIPNAEIFGTDVLSRTSPAISELSPIPYLTVHPNTATKHELNDGATVKVSWNEQSTSLTVKVCEQAPEQGALIPARFAATRSIQTPVWASVGGKT